MNIYERGSVIILCLMCIVFICGCTVPLEGTRNLLDESAVTSTDLAKERTAPAAAGKQVDNSAIAAITSIEVANEFVNITASKPFGYKFVDTADQYNKVIELYDVSPGRFEDIILPASTRVADIKVRPAGDRKTGAVVQLTLSSIVEIKDKFSENTLTLAFNKPAADVGAEPAVSETKPQQKKGQLSPGKNITGIRLVKESDKSAGVEITGDGLLTPDVSTLNGRVIVDFRGLKITAVVPKDITPPISAIRGGQHPDKVRIVIDLSKNAVYKVDQQGEKVVVYVADAALMSPLKTPPSKTQTAQDEVAGKPSTIETGQHDAPAPTDNLITLDYNSVDIMAALKLIANVSSFNIVVDPRVSGKTTIHVKDIPWDKALDLVVESNKLKKTVEGNVIKILPGQEPHASANVKSGQPALSINEISITFSDAGGAMKTIKRANAAAGSASICIDLTSSEIQPAVIPPSIRQVAAQKPVIAQKKPVHTKNSNKRKGKKR